MFFTDLPFVRIAFLLSLEDTILEYPKDPASFHFSTPVIGAIPQCFNDANKVLSLQAHGHTSFFLFIPHAAQRHLSWDISEAGFLTEATRIP